MGLGRKSFCVAGTAFFLSVLCVAAPAQAEKTISPRDARMEAKTSWDYQPGQGPYRTRTRDERLSVSVEKQEDRAAPDAAASKEVEAFGLKTETSIEVGMRFFSSHYHEDGAPEMQTQGALGGVSAAYTGALGKGWFTRTEGQISAGQSRYKDAARHKDVPSYTGEIRTTFGKDLFWRDYSFSPYVGLGYRYQQNDIYRFGGAATEKFQQRGQLLFLPIGVTKRRMLSPGARLSGSFEFDPVLQGWQDYKMDDISTAWPSVQTKQGFGYGLRGDVAYETRRLSIGPFVSYWNMGASERSCGTSATGVTVCGSTPHNHSLEYGLALRYRFQQE